MDCDLAQSAGSIWQVSPPAHHRGPGPDTGCPQATTPHLTRDSSVTPGWPQTGSRIWPSDVSEPPSSGNVRVTPTGCARSSPRESDSGKHRRRPQLLFLRSLGVRDSQGEVCGLQVNHDPEEKAGSCPSRYPGRRELALSTSPTRQRQRRQAWRRCPATSHIELSSLARRQKRGSRLPPASCSSLRASATVSRLCSRTCRGVRVASTTHRHLRSQSCSLSSCRKSGTLPRPLAPSGAFSVRLFHDGSSADPRRL